MPTVLITGAAGRVGAYLRAGLPTRGWQLRLLDTVAIADEPDAVQADIGDTDALAGAMEGVDAVVHLAAVVKTDAPFADILTGNIDGTYQVFEAARQAGVARVVFASSNHANGFAPRAPEPSAASTDRPDSYYGVSKLFGEALGRLYVDRYGLQIACIRIGSCFDRPRGPRMLGSWLSPNDAARLVHACLTYPELDYAVVYGISDNSRRWWDLGPARALGYEPEDNAERFAAEVLAPFGGEDPSEAGEPQGGASAWVASADGSRP